MTQATDNGKILYELNYPRFPSAPAWEDQSEEIQRKWADFARPSEQKRTVKAAAIRLCMLECGGTCIGTSALATEEETFAAISKECFRWQAFAKETDHW